MDFLMLCTEKTLVFCCSTTVTLEVQLKISAISISITLLFDSGLTSNQTDPNSFYEKIAETYNF